MSGNCSNARSFVRAGGHLQRQGKIVQGASQRSMRHCTTGITSELSSNNICWAAHRPRRGPPADPFNGARYCPFLSKAEARALGAGRKDTLSSSVIWIETS